MRTVVRFVGTLGAVVIVLVIVGALLRRLPNPPSPTGAPQIAATGTSRPAAAARASVPATPPAPPTSAPTVRASVPATPPAPPTSAPTVAYPELIDSRYLTIMGIKRIELADAAGQTLDLDVTTGMRSGSSDIQIHGMSDTAALLILPSDERFSLRLSGIPGGIVNIEAVRGKGNRVVNQLVRFRDLAVPPASTILFTVLPDGIAEVQVDDTSDGTIDHTYAPDVSVSDPVSVDITAPTITFTRTLLANNQMEITLVASDPSGVARLLYSLDGSLFNPYAGPITLDPYTTPYVHAFADDTLTNRSSSYPMATRLLSLGGPTTVAEGQASLTIPVRIDLPGGQVVRVEYEIDPGSATADADYGALRGTLEFAPDQQELPITIPISDDLIVETDETFTVTLSFPENAGFAVRQQQVTISDND
jgi:hypothetical protein